jgi:sugar phosphate isomerase/epimerase
VSRPLEIGICTWCIDRHAALRGIAVAGGELGLRVVQVGFFGEAAVNGADAAALKRAAADAGVEIAGVFVAFDEEDYASVDRIAQTGGFAPDDAYPRRLELMRRAAGIAAAVGCGSVAVHAGTVPEEAGSPPYAKLVARTAEAADAAAALGVRLLLETGRESADALVACVASVGRPNVGVNFDPGNFVTYGTDDPVRAVTKLRGRIELVHLKDAVASPRPGVEFGRKAPLGTGDVQIPRVISKLRAAGYAGPLLLETPAPSSPMAEYRAAVDYLRSMLE